MIAPLRSPEAPARPLGRGLREARRLVAATFLRGKPADAGPRVPAWKAWLFVAWLLLSTTAFGLAMLGGMGN